MGLPEMKRKVRRDTPPTTTKTQRRHWTKKRANLAPTSVLVALGESHHDCPAISLFFVARKHLFKQHAASDCLFRLQLGGIVKPNDGSCHLENGEYTQSVHQDYPSLSQINAKIQEHKVNIIFAVTADQIGIYEKLGNQLEGCSSGRLENDSSNVVQLVREQYDVSGPTTPLSCLS